MHPWLEKMPMNGLTCIAWILQGPLDVTNELNWCALCCICAHSSTLLLPIECLLLMPN